MTYQIILISAITNPDNSFSVNGVFWLTANSNNIVPAPGFQSQVPFIDTTDLVSLQNGLLIEQSFNSGNFPSGTSLATVQSTLQTQYTTAQTNLSALNPALSQMVGTTYNGAAWTTSSPFSSYGVGVVTGTLGALNASVQLNVSNAQSVGVQVEAGTFIGTIIAETSFDGGAIWNQTLFVFAGNTSLFSKSYSIAYTTANYAQAASIIVNGGSGLVRVYVYAYTSGSCNIVMRSSGIYDETLSLSTALPGYPLPPVFDIVGGSVTTTVPVYTADTANALSLNTSGGLRVDGSGVTQPVSGTVATTQSTSPWADNITEIGGVAVAAVAKGVQATNALGVQELKDSGRTPLVYEISAVAGVTTEALLSLTPLTGFVAGAAATTFTITSGKTFRIQAMTLTVRTTTTVAAGAVVRLRITSTGTPTTSTPVTATVGATSGSGTTVSGWANSATVTFPDGLELSGTMEFAISTLASSTSCTLDVSLIGFIY
jgi:hypothetical protein